MVIMLIVVREFEPAILLGQLEQSKVKKTNAKLLLETPVS